MVSNKNLCDAFPWCATVIITVNENIWPKCSTRGQGCVIIQLTKVGNQIRPDLQTQVMKTKTALNIPNKEVINPMAPATLTKKKAVPATVSGITNHNNCADTSLD
jgi:hypothetical protein